MATSRLRQLQNEIVQCRLCPRLVEHRERVAREKRRAFRDCEYWGKPVPSLGKRNAELLIVGLAPAAHGANRTGRMFTGDRSGDFLYETLHRFGFSNQPSSLNRGDKLDLLNCYITAAIHCAPPANKPTRDELDCCSSYLKRELKLLNKVRVVVALGRIAWRAYLLAREQIPLSVPRPWPPFSHAASCHLDKRTMLITSYHPSQQNTQTGRLTHQMFNAVFAKARKVPTS